MKTGEERNVGPSFVLRKKDDGVFGRYIEFAVRNSDFCVRWGEELMIYHLLDSFAKEQEDAIHTWLSVVYCMCQIIDAELTDVCLQGIGRYMERRGEYPEDAHNEAEAETENREVLDDRKKGGDEYEEENQ